MMSSVRRELRASAIGVPFTGLPALMESVPKSMWRYSTLPVKFPVRRAATPPPMVQPDLVVCARKLAELVPIVVIGLPLASRTGLALASSSGTRFDPEMVPTCEIPAIAYPPVA